jgi:DNA gyrase inhibitor GyrI
MESLSGSKMYGLLYPGAPMAYFASVRLDRDHSDDLGFDQAEVPGGLYGRRLVKDWEDKLAELPEIFDELHADLIEAGYFVDTSRPSLEFYRRSNELVIMVPVLPAEVGPSDLNS